VKRFSIVLPPGDTLAVGGRTLDVSPDGKTLVYAALRDGKRHLFTRAADSGAVTLLPGTEGGGRPFFSPDGEWVGFIGSLDLRKLSLRGGTPVLLAQVAFNATAVWGLSGQIILSSSEIDPLSVVPEAGGMPKPLTALSGGGGEIAHLWPSLLPGKDAVLFMAWSGSGDEGSRLAVADLDSGRITDLGVRGMSPRYAPSGHLLFGHAGTLFAVRFDPGSRRVRGTPVPVVSGVMTFARFGVSQYALSGDGTLYYIRGEPGGSEGSLTWVDTTGASELVMEPTNGFQSARLSPDGNRLALSIREPDPDIWVHDLRRKTLTRVTFAPGEDESPVWSPDGASLAYTSNGRKKTFLLSLDGSGREEELVSREHHYHVRSWSPDGKWLFFEEFVSPNNSDIWALPLRQPRTPRLLAHSRFSESAPKISPNGRWLAYASNESGRSEIYIQPFPGPGRRVQVSTLGGREPVWARSGGELFFQRETKVVSVRVGGGAEPEAEGERVICEIGPEPDATWLFDISTDGRRFIVANPPVPKDRPTEIQVVVNWLEELEQKVPVKGH
jgi:serine/threonine-protein kinase